MAVPMTFNLSGDKEFMHRLAAVESDLRNRAIQRGLSAGALIVAGNVKEHLYVGHGQVTGTYKRSVGQSPRGPDTWGVGTNLPQGPRLEYGFIGTDKLGRRYNQAPIPHFRPGLRESRDEVLEAFRTVVNHILRSAR